MELVPATATFRRRIVRFRIRPEKGGSRPVGWCSSRFVVRVVDVGGHRAVFSENCEVNSPESDHTMALDQHALLDLLGELKLTEVPDRIRQATSGSIRS